MIAAAAQWSVAQAHTGDMPMGVGSVPVVARVQGLALGNSLQLRQGGVTVTATLNEPMTVGTAPAGSVLQLQVLNHPDGQRCAVSASAPATVAPDAAPVFVRCWHVPAVSLQMPATLPSAPLSNWVNGAALRAIAYPGIRYESRMGVRGGTFPYEFRLQAADANGVPMDPASIELDFRRGMLAFVPEAAGTYSFSIEIRDSGAPQQILQYGIDIHASSAPFLFVAPDGVDAPQRGSREQPFASVPYALAQSAPDQALLLRTGVYPALGLNLGDQHSKQLLGYPDEVATLDLLGAERINIRTSAGVAARIEQLDIINARQYALMSDPARPGLVVRNVRFFDASVANGSENPAFIHGWGDNIAPTRHRLLVQDNHFGAFPDGYAMTLFDAGDSIVENNQVRMGASTRGIHDKDNSQRNVYRENYLEYAPAYANDVGIQVSAQANSEQVHIHHNLLVNTGILLGGQCVASSCVMRDHDVHHNTLDARGVILRWGVFNPDSGGTRFSHNLVRSTLAPYTWASCLSAVPAGFSVQLQAQANRFETGSTRAMRDSECNGSAMEIPWAAWRNTHGLDTLASGSVLSATSDLTGSGALTRLPVGDPRLNLLGHRYALPAGDSVPLFGDGFE